MIITPKAAGMHSIAPRDVIYPYSRNENMQMMSEYFAATKYAPGLLVHWHKSSIKISAGFGDKLNWHYPYLTICRAMWGTWQQRTNITEGDCQWSVSTFCVWFIPSWIIHSETLTKVHNHLNSVKGSRPFLSFNSDNNGIFESIYFHTGKRDFASRGIL